MLSLLKMLLTVLLMLTLKLLLLKLFMLLLKLLLLMVLMIVTPFLIMVSPHGAIVKKQSIRLRYLVHVMHLKLLLLWQKCSCITVTSFWTSKGLCY